MKLNVIQSKIYEIRGQKVMLDFDLAELYEVETRALNQAVKRNSKRFPEDFMFRISEKEWELNWSQFVASSESPINKDTQTDTGSRKEKMMPSQIVTASKTKAGDASQGNDLSLTLNSSQTVMSSLKHRGAKYLPFAFTEQGVAMLSGVLNSDKAINVNISIMRAFVKIREFALTHEELAMRLSNLERKNNKQFKDVFEALNLLLSENEGETNWNGRERIGYKK